MGKIIGKDLEDIIECIRDGKSVAGGGIATAMTGLVATVLTRKSLDSITHTQRERMTPTEVDELDWVLADAELHYIKLLDKERDASVAVRDLTLEKDRGSGNNDEPKLTGEEVYRAALSVSAAIATSAARVLKVAARLAETAPSDYLADLGISVQMLYATFIGGKMKINHYFVHAPEMDKDFIARTRDKVYELEDEVSKLAGTSLERVWTALHPKDV